MRILLPTENALFMRYWRPKTRPERLLPLVVILVIVLVLVVFQCHYAAILESVSDTSKALTRSFRTGFGFVVGIQALLLLLLGSYAAGAAAFNESSSGAMDFHRASATSPMNQVLGLVFGATAPAYILFALTIPVALLLAVEGGFTGWGFLAAQASILLSGIFWQGISALIGFRHDKKHAIASSSASGLACVFLGHLAAIYLAPVSFSSLTTSIPVLIRVFAPENSYVDAEYPLLFGLRHHALLMQAMVQVPLIAIMAAALRRGIKLPNRPDISKGLALWLALVLLALSVSGFHGHDMVSARHIYLVFFLFFAFVLGCLLAASVTPQYGLYCQGLHRRKKLKDGRIRLLDDSSGNLTWVLCYSVMVAVFYLMVVALAPRGVWALPVSLAATLLYFGWFAAALEYFRLGPSKRRRPAFMATISILWLLVPAFGFFASLTESEIQAWESYLMSACPLFGIPATAGYEYVSAGGFKRDWLFTQVPGNVSTLLVVLGVNLVLLVVFIYLGMRARAKIAERIKAQGQGG